MPTVTPRRTTRIIFNTVEGGVLNFPARVEGGRVTRTLGLAGDEVVVLVRASDWPLPNGPTTGGGVDFKQPCTLRFGNFDGPEPLIDLEHYYVRQIDPMMVTAANVDDPSGNGVGAGGVSLTAKLVRIRFVTLPGYLRGDGRGALLREKTFNHVLSSGEVDSAGDDYVPVSSLVDMCLSALNLAYETSPVSLDDSPPPGPLNWGNANALHELEALLDFCGHAIALPNHGDQCRLLQLPKRADTITLDSDVTAALSKPFIVAKAPALRSDVVVVHSGDTRTTVLTFRRLDALEWVWFDEKAYRWKNTAQTIASGGGGGINPDDIVEFRKGPSPTDEAARAQYARLFRAVRLSGSDKGLRLIQGWEPATFGDGTKLGSTAAYAKGRVSAPIGQEQFVGVPLDRAADKQNLGSCDVHAEAGVFILPSEFVYARPATDFTGTQTGTHGRGDMSALTADDLTVYFAHEARFAEIDGGYRKNYFVAAWKVTWSGSALVYTELTGDDLILAIDDPTTVKVAAPWLKRLVKFDPGDVSPVDVNFTALKAQALEVAKRRASLALAEGGVAECKGWLDKFPGCCSGACSSVTWDLENYTTTLVLNDHETPDGEMDQRALAANRSFAAGVNRFALPGSAVDLVDVRSSVVPGISQSGTGNAAAAGGGGGKSAGNHPETAAATAGHENASKPAGSANPPSDKPVGGVQAVFGGGFVARITGSTSLPGNRWSYSWTQVRVITSGAEAGTVVPVNNPMTNVTHGLAYNLAEAHNDGSGIEGNGINVSNLPAGWGLQPVPTGAVVMVLFCARDASGGPGRAVFFERDNAVDGACPSSGGAGGSTELRPSSDGVLAALDMVLTDAAGEVLLDAAGGVLLNADSVSLSLSDLRAFDHWLTDTSGAGRVFVVDAGGSILIGDSASEVSPASEQLIDRVLTDAAGQPLTDDAGNLLASV